MILDILLWICVIMLIISNHMQGKFMLEFYNEFNWFRNEKK